MLEKHKVNRVSQKLRRNPVNMFLEFCGILLFCFVVFFTSMLYVLFQRVQHSIPCCIGIYPMGLHRNPVSIVNIRRGFMYLPTRQNAELPYYPALNTFAICISLLFLPITRCLLHQVNHILNSVVSAGFLLFYSKYER